jgi:hypothetical protein
MSYQTRPFISVSLVSRFMHSPQNTHWLALNHILRYSNFTKDYGILYKPGVPSQLCGFTNADYLNCKNTRQSIGAYLIQLASNLIAWASKQQPTVLDSTIEVEYKALSNGAKEEKK